MAGQARRASPPLSALHCWLAGWLGGGRMLRGTVPPTFPKGVHCQPHPCMVPWVPGDTFPAIPPPFVWTSMAHLGNGIGNGQLFQSQRVTWVSPAGTGPFERGAAGKSHCQHCLTTSCWPLPGEGLLSAFLLYPTYPLGLKDLGAPTSSHSGRRAGCLKTLTWTKGCFMGIC